MNSLFRTLRLALRRRRFEDEMAEEMRFHLEARVEDLIAQGLGRDEATRRAAREFGRVLRAQDDCRKARGLERLDEIWADLRLAFRRLGRTRGFTATALATLALVLGANLAIFAVVDAVLLRPLPFPKAEALVTVYNSYPKAGITNDGCSILNYYERRGKIAAFSSVAAYREGTAILGTTGSVERESILRVTADFFATLGVRTARGRDFRESDLAKEDVVILSDSYWRERLGGDPQVLGRGVRIDGRERIVVGVLPRDFVFLSTSARLFLPLVSRPNERLPAQRHAGTADMIARLRAGAAIEEARAQVAALDAALGVDDPYRQPMLEAGFHSVVESLRPQHVAAVRPVLLATQAGALALLAIGLVNLLNLLLLRASARSREVAIRQAIGASRRHAVVDVLVETLVLVVAGGVLGLGVGALGIRLLAALGADRLPLGASIRFDGPLALVSLGASLAIGFGLGLAVAMIGLHTSSPDTLRNESRGGTAGRSSLRLRDGFVVAQIALAFVLLAGTGLFVLSLRKMNEVGAGIHAERVLSARLSLATRFPTTEARLGFLERLATELARRPEVSAVGFASNVPLSGTSNVGAITPAGSVRRQDSAPHGQYLYSVDGEAMAALGFELLEGRLLTSEDSRRSERVVVVDQAFAQRAWPQGHALGQRLFEGPDERSPEEAFTVVGVVGSVKQRDLAEREPLGAVFFPLGHRSERDLFVILRTTSEPKALSGFLRTTVRALDPELSVADVRTMAERVAETEISRRSPALLASLFSVLALLLTAIGTYGIAGFVVAQRRREIAVRIALGALPSQVRHRLLLRAGGLVLSGLALGTCGVALLGRFLEVVLFDVPSFHGATLAWAAVLLALAVGCAFWGPVARVARLAPREVLSEG